jgi:hypothetical protein
MKRLVPLAVLALLALTDASAAAAGSTTYEGKTSSGHTITFQIAGGNLHDVTAGVRVSCIPIQGGGMPLGGSEVFGFRGSTAFKRHVRFSFMSKPAFHYSEVTMNHDMWLKRRGRRITGRLRIQYSFLVPKYPPGTFAVYSCLGGATFASTARG